MPGKEPKQCGELGIHLLLEAVAIVALPIMFVSASSKIWVYEGILSGAITEFAMIGLGLAVLVIYQFANPRSLLQIFFSVIKAYRK